jgi:hypothetical protein
LAIIHPATEITAIERAAVSSSFRRLRLAAIEAGAFLMNSLFTGFAALRNLPSRGLDCT